jgi:cobalt-zinc-cadmium efflux system outer membrane protein
MPARFLKQTQRDSNPVFLSKFFSLCIATLVLLSTSVAAEDNVFTIDGLVKLIIQHNPTLLTSRRSLDVATAGVTTAGARPNPRLEGNTGQLSATSPAGQGSLTGFGVSQLFENPALRSARIDAAQSVERGSLQFVAATKNEVVAKIRLRAFEYLLRKEELLAATDALQLLEQIRQRVKVKVDTGEAGKYELIKAETEIINASQREQTSRLQVEQAVLNLNRLAAGKLPASWELDASLNDLMELEPMIYIELAALKANPELSVLQADVDRAQAKFNEAVASRWPGIELRYIHQREPEARQNILSMSIQVPLVDQRAGPRAEAIADRERARTRLEGRRDELQQQLALAWRSVEVARLRIKALDEGAMRGAEAALSIAQAAYRYGERGILDVLDAERVLRSVRSDLLLARYELQASTIELDFLAGRYVNVGN